MAWSVKRRQLLALAIGAGIAAALFWSFDPKAIAGSVAAIGWGLFVISLHRLLSIACDARAWGCLIPAAQRPGFLQLLAFRCMAKSVNTFLPAMQVGGDLLRVHMLWRSGLPVGSAGASVLVDAILNLAAQIAYTLLGIAAIGWLGTGSSAIGPLLGVLLIGCGIVVAFYVALRRGFLQFVAGWARRLARLAGAGPERFAEGLVAVEQESEGLFRSPDALRGGWLWHLASWLLRTGETWLALYFMGAEITLTGALIIESLSIAVRTAAFAIPGGLGAQEAAILVVGAFVGLAPETALALAVVKRVREFLVFGPGLLAWWIYQIRVPVRLRGRTSRVAPLPPVPAVRSPGTET